MTNSALPESIELRNHPYARVPGHQSEEDTAYDPGDLNRDSVKSAAQPRKSRFSGWRGGVLAALVTTQVVLLVNIVLTVVAATAWDPVDGVATAYTGGCTTAARMTTGIHLLINLLSSILLGASNYCMQRLVAPTRGEVDKAHSQRVWLDIGMPSVKNLSRIGKGRLALWLLLALSSMPLHLVFNSAVFETIAANNVNFLIVGPEFFTDKNSWKADVGNNNILDGSTDNFITQLQNRVLDGKYMDRKLFRNLTGDECVRKYTGNFITEVGAGYGVPVADARTNLGMSPTNSLLLTNSASGGLVIQPYNGGPEYEYCLSEIVPLRCKVQFSLTILYWVIATNVAKIILMTITLWRLNEQTLVTIGDAVKSFLREPDPSTEDCCLMSRRNIKTVWNVPEARLNQRFEPGKRRPWFSACSLRRWLFSMFLYVGSLATAGAFTVVMRNSLKERGNYNSNGFGKVNIDFLIDAVLPFGDTSIIPFVLLANVPQAIVSFIYLTYNGLFTCMLANREWSRYAMKRAPLRVTVPTAAQRSTYFLQLPYLWSLPLMVASILLHWFVSQSIFLARMQVYRDGTPVNVVLDRLGMYHNLKMANGVFTGVGYSDRGLQAVIGWGAAMVLVILVIAIFFQYPKGLPLGGTNSAVISAACHVKYEDADEARKVEEDEDVSEKPLKWGVTIEGTRDRVGHCSFSAGEVGAPVVGCLYARTSKEKGD